MRTFDCPSCKGTIQGDDEGIAQHQAECAGVAADPRDQEIADLKSQVDARDKRIVKMEHDFADERKVASDAIAKLLSDEANLCDQLADLQDEMAAANRTITEQSRRIAELTAAPAPPATAPVAPAAPGDEQAKSA